MTSWELISRHLGDRQNSFPPRLSAKVASIKNTQPLSSRHESLILPFAVVVPTWLAFNIPPATALLNQILALLGWGGVLVLSLARDSARLRLQSGASALAALLLLIVALLWSTTQALPQGLSLQMALCLLAAAGLVLLASSKPLPACPTSPDEDGKTFSDAILLAATGNAVVSVIQIFLPDWADGTFIVSSHNPGRAEGNLRQPNHLALLLLWGLVAWVAAASTGRWFRLRWGWAASALSGAVLLLALVLSASRTGMLGLALFAIWGGLDRRLPAKLRAGMVASPLLYGCLWFAVLWWAENFGRFFGGQAHLAEADLSSYRIAIWSDALQLIARNPWVGVGFGEFNFAWTLSPNSARSPLLFDHCHNLPLQLLVELGIPLGGLVFGLLLLAFRQGQQRTWLVQGNDAVVGRACWMMVVMIGMHSMLEYPLWYADCLLPTAWAVGLSLRQSSPPIRSPSSNWAGKPLRLALGILGLSMIGGSLLAHREYRLITSIFSPSGLAPAEERIRLGQSSLVFSYLADYAAATSPVRSPAKLIAQGVFRESTHALLNVDLMVAWATALNDSGQPDKARYLAERLREFDLPEAKAFFTICDKPTLIASHHDYFQCTPSQGPHSWRDFMP